MLAPSPEPYSVFGVIYEILIIYQALPGIKWESGINIYNREVGNALFCTWERWGLQLFSPSPSSLLDSLLQWRSGLYYEEVFRQFD